jgi:hypothetical protein
VPTEAAERIYREWHDAFCRNDVPALLRLYAPDATIESPSIPHLMDRADGICRGIDDIRVFLTRVAARKPQQPFYRAGYVTDGHRLIWEYPRQTPDGEQMEFVEVMDIDEGLIRRHRVYWGWRALDCLAHADMPDVIPEQAYARLIQPRKP